MSEDKTKETKDTRTFEERVFAKFDRLDRRFDRLELRLELLCPRLDSLIATDDAMRQRWEEVMEEVGKSAIPVSSPS